ncbi:MAG: hypothetical protein HA492_01410 [Candidatus Verstraetearchaeota archaeon]|jgi:hypothetical protein|nr:hypothetical protein [Candidatus Verstraetearchaeota archaeon]
MENITLRIPFSIPLLGESFIDFGNPVLFSTINFFTEVDVNFNKSSVAHVPLSSPSLKRLVENHLNSIGKPFAFQVSPPGHDYLTLTSALYIAASESLEDHAPAFLSRLSGRSLMTMVRSLSALSGGFVVCRKGEGLVSLSGNPDASVLLRTKARRRFLRGAIGRFNEAFPDLSQPLWHTMGHIVIEGGRAIKENNPRKLGYLMILESSIGCAIGLIKPKDLARLSRIKVAYGAKIVSFGDLTGDLILSQRETSPWGEYQKFYFTTTGVNEVHES